jgi:CelD/BcsL family acetyltransferase involved in cellulose biosynthesis
LEIRIISDFAALEALRPQWERLRGCASRRDVFQDFSWISHWWRNLGGPYSLCTLAAGPKEGAIAIFPLLRDGSAARFIGFSASDYNALLCEPGCEQEILPACLSHLFRNTKVNRVVLENVPSDSPLAHAARELAPPWGRATRITDGEPCPALVFGDRKAEVLASVLGKEKMRKAVRYLGRHGELAFRHLEDQAELDTHLDEFFRQHVRRSALVDRRSTFLNAAVAAFYRDLLRDETMRGEVRFSVLELSGRPVAYHFGFLVDGRYLYYKPTFDIDLGDLSPGQVLLYYLLDYAKGADVHEFDYGQGGEAYKFRFSNQVNPSVRIEICRPGFAAMRMRMLEPAHRWKAAMLAAEKWKAPVQRVRHWKSVMETAGAASGGRLAASFLFGKEEWIAWRHPKPAADGARIDSEYAFEPATLSGFADEAVKHEDWLLGDVLQDARLRMKQGQTLYLMRRQKAVCAVVWMQETDRLFSDTAVEQRLTANALVADLQFIDRRDADRLVAAASAWLVAEAARGGLELWILAPVSQGAAPFGAQGLDRRYVFRRITRLGRVAWERRDIR